MVEHTFVFALAIVPGMAICWYIYRMDKYEKESRLQLAVTFALGMAITYPVLKIEAWASHSGWAGSSTLGATFVSSFIVVALTEELAKYLAIMGYPYSRPFFNEPMDGIVYAVMISMGFATLENVLYAGRFGFQTTLLRAFTAVPAHACFAIIMGYFVGRSKFALSTASKSRLLALGLAVPIGVHGVYDFFILQEYYEELVLLALLILGASVYIATRLIKEQQENSPFKEK
ncbi:MAG: PrsW family intramembrane metalloprotease [Phaeodactylibacter sp.]|nr:PrsW family intramembrane metalloprotease [Phaeodactylibacter sp.]MCB9267602.1 PrsW family intramembrane metalloprotease [Lewinellaceae bacterium]